MNSLRSSALFIIRYYFSIKQITFIQIDFRTLSIFFANKGIFAIGMASELDVNYKTALKLCNKCRIFMSLSNSEKILDSLFYEADTLYIGTRTKGGTRNGY